MVAGSLTYDTKMDTTGFQKGINDITSSTKKGGTTIKNIVAGLGITKLITSAISTIKSSIDGAVNRVDTLNNFPKVMGNLGISSEKSEKSINKVSDKLKGLPTTLDDAALSIQRFTATNGDVEKSTDYFLAFNDAVLAGGAGTELQKSALEQLSQAYSKGKPDMMEWRTLMMAMPAQLKQVSTSLGRINTDDLYKGLQDSSISMETFMDAIVELDKKGTGEFLSFERQAKNAVGGVGTSITNAKTAVTRGVANIVDSIDKSLKQEGFGGLGKVISDIGSVAEKVLGNVAKFASNLIKVLKDIFDWFSKHQTVATTLLSIIKGLIAGFITYKTVLIAINAINIAKRVTSTMTAFIGLIPEIKSAKDAFVLLQMVIKKNVLAVLISTIVAATTAIIAFINSSKNVDKELEETKNKADEQAKSWKELKDTRKTALESSEKEIGVTQKLADELREITNENGEVKKGYENRAKYILGELNTALGTEYKMNGNIIQGYKDLKENVDKLIKSKRAEATLNAYKGEYEEAIKKQTEATKTLIDLRKKLQEIESTADGDNADRVIKSIKIEEINDKIRQQTNLLGEYGYTIEKYEKLTSASVSDSAEEIDDALKDMSKSYDEAKEKMDSSLGSQIKSQGDYVKRLKSEWEKAKNNNDKYQEQILKTQLDTQKKELDSLATSLAEQTSTIGDLSPDIVEAWKDLASNSEEAYAEALKKVPPETAKQIQEATGIIVKDSSLRSASAQEGKEATNAYSDNLQYKSVTKEELADSKDTIRNNTSIQNASEKLGQNGNKAFKGNYKIASEVKSILDDVATKMKENVKLPNASSSLGNSVNSNFWSKVQPYNWGYDIPEEISKGMNANKSVLGFATGALAGIISSHLHFSEPDIGPLSNFHTYMPDMIKLMAQGINDNKYKVIDAIYGLTSDMEQQMKSAVNLEVGNMNATATVRSNNMYNSVINLNASFDGTVEMDGEQTGRIITPYVTRTIRAGGAY